MFSEKSGTVNIALEGIMVIGAFAGIYFISIMQEHGYLANVPLLLLSIAMVISIVAGMLFASLLGFLAINMKANQTIGGVALNILAAALAIFLARTLTKEGVSHIKFNNSPFKLRVNYLKDLFPNLAPGSIEYKIVNGLNNVFLRDGYIFIYLAVIIFIVSSFIINRTRFGLRLSACGEHPHAAQSVGVNVYRYRWAGVLISGALAGLGGLIYIIPTSVSFHGTVTGYGFLALAVLIFGQWKPFKILLAAIFFGIFKTLSATYFGIPFISNLMENYKNIPFGMLFNLMPYIITLIALSISSKSSRAPKASGIPFDAKGM